MVKNLDSLIANAIPSESGLYPNELIVLHFADGFDNKYKNEIRYNMINIKGFEGDINVILRKLFIEGFIRLETTEECYERTSIKQVREEINSLGLNIKSRTKSVLTNAILNSADDSYLDNRFSTRYFRLTEKGVKELRENDYINYLIWAQDQAVLDMWELNRLVNTPPFLPVNDKLWGYLNNLVASNNPPYNMIGAKRNLRYHMMNFCLHEHNYNAAILQACFVMYIDLNGFYAVYPERNDEPELRATLIENMCKLIFPDDNVPPFSFIPMNEIRDGLNIDDERFYLLLRKCASKCYYPKSIFKNNEFADMLVAYYSGQQGIINQIYDEVKQRFRSEMVLMDPTVKQKKKKNLYERFVRFFST